MKYNVEFVYPADLELDDTVVYYNIIMDNLGNRFFQEVSKAIERIIQFPEAWTKIGKVTRRCLIDKFPYALYYFVENYNIYILAVANLRREPEYYLSRIL